MSVTGKSRRPCVLEFIIVKIYNNHMARLVIILALVAGFIMLYRSLFRANPRLEDSSEASEMIQDPNCGVYVPKNQAIARSVLGEEHFFCSEKCADEYPSKKS
jgi:YHS domain-containing protein